MTKLLLCLPLAIAATAQPRLSVHAGPILTEPKLINGIGFALDPLVGVSAGVLAEQRMSPTLTATAEVGYGQAGSTFEIFDTAEPVDLDNPIAIRRSIRTHLLTLAPGSGFRSPTQRLPPISSAARSYPSSWPIKT